MTKTYGNQTGSLPPLSNLSTWVVGTRSSARKPVGLENAPALFEEESLAAVNDSRSSPKAARDTVVYERFALGSALGDDALDASRTREGTMALERAALEAEVKRLEKLWLALPKRIGRLQAKEQLKNDLEAARRRLDAVRRRELVAKRALRLTDALFMGGMEVNRAAALLVLPAMCRKEGIRIVFGGIPHTDGRTIWLGQPDLSNPAAPIYLWASGIHERCHVRYSDFEVGQNVTPVIHELFNILEDVRVDALGIGDYAGYRIWREALVALVLEESDGPLGRDPATMAIPEVFMIWLWLTLVSRVLGLKMPEKPVERLLKAADEQFGEVFLKDLGEFVLDRFPLKRTADSLALANEINKRIERERSDAFEEVCRMEEGTGPLAPVMIDEGPQGALFGLDGLTATAEALPGVSSVGDPRRRLRVLEALMNRWLAWKDPISAATRTLAQKVTNVSRGIPSPEALEASLGTDLAAGRLLEAEAREAAAGRARRGAHDADYYGAVHGHTARFSPGEARKALRAFRRTWPETAGMAGAFVEALRRRVPEPILHAESGWDVDGDVLDRVRSGDARIFEVRAPAGGWDLAVQITVDLSGSVPVESAAVLKATALRLEEALRRTSGCAVRTGYFPCGDKSVALASDWAETLEQAKLRLAPIPGRGPTPVCDALCWGTASLAEREESVKRLVVLTDGIFRLDEVASHVAAARSFGIEVCFVMVRGDEPAQDASKVYGCPAHIVNDWTEIPPVLAKIVRAWPM